MTGLNSFARLVFGRYVAALEFPEFRTMWLAHLAAQAAGWALIVARGWFIFDLTGSSFVVGLVTFAAMMPMMLMPPIAGVLADRLDRRTLLASTYAINMVITLILAILALVGALNESLVVLLTLANGLARATQQSTSQALAANLVPSHRLLNALSLTAATQHMAKLVGPGLVAPVLGLSVSRPPSSSAPASTGSAGCRSCRSAPAPPAASSAATASRRASRRASPTPGTSRSSAWCW
jgi:MFS family permease